MIRHNSHAISHRLSTLCSLVVKYLSKRILFQLHTLSYSCVFLSPLILQAQTRLGPQQLFKWAWNIKSKCLICWKWQNPLISRISRLPVPKWWSAAKQTRSRNLLWKCGMRAVEHVEYGSLAFAMHAACRLSSNINTIHSHFVVFDEATEITTSDEIQ